MTIEVKDTLRRWAQQYETVKFIEADPIQIPHRYTDERDIEISAFVTAWLAWGNRKSIIAAADYIDRVLFKGEPYQYIMRGDWAFLENNYANLYRTYTHSDFAELCCTLRSIYITYSSMENWLFMVDRTTFSRALECIRGTFAAGRIKGIPAPDSPSACKRLCMFLRWMVRKGPVDFGIWTIFKRGELVIPLDTHVIRMAKHLGIAPTTGVGSLPRITPTMKNAVALTEAMREVFGDDPCRADFALFGAGIEGADKE